MQKSFFRPQKFTQTQKTQDLLQQFHSKTKTKTKINTIFVDVKNHAER